MLAMGKQEKDFKVVQKSTRYSLRAVFNNLGWPVFLGLIQTAVFYTLFLNEPLKNDFTNRYFAAHPVAFASTFLFFVGLSSLVRLAMGVGAQLHSLKLIELESLPGGGQPVAACATLLEQLGELPSSLRNSYLGRRLHDALDLVKRKGSAHGLDDELKFLADSDAGRQQDGYSLARITIWAIPMLGFLGTVLGLMQCLQGFSAKQIATDIHGAMDSTLSGLYLKFGTSAQSLSLSTVLMFMLFLVERFENQLLSEVDARASQELVGRFFEIGAGTDPHLQSIQRMSEAVIKSNEQLVHRQAQLWQSTIDAAHQRWSHLTDNSSQQVHQVLLETLETSLTNHAEQWQEMLSQNAQLMQAQQREMMKQSELMLRIAQATGEVGTLEQRLNDNLQALAGSKNFEDTVMSLSAAIHLLTTRLEPDLESTPRVNLRRKTSQNRAA